MLLFQTVLMCLFRLLFFVTVIVHLSHLNLFSRCAESTCSLTLFFCLKVLLQELHSYLVFPWSDRIWVFREHLSLNVTSQVSHSYILLWFPLMCLFKTIFLEKVFSQRSHLNVNFSWIANLCLLKLHFHSNDFSHDFSEKLPSTQAPSSQAPKLSNC